MVRILSACLCGEILNFRSLDYYTSHSQTVSITQCWLSLRWRLSAGAISSLYDVWNMSSSNQFAEAFNRDSCQCQPCDHHDPFRTARPECQLLRPGGVVRDHPRLTGTKHPNAQRESAHHEPEQSSRARHDRSWRPACRNLWHRADRSARRLTQTGLAHLLIDPLCHRARHGGRIGSDQCPVETPGRIRSAQWQEAVGGITTSTPLAGPPHPHGYHITGDGAAGIFDVCATVMFAQLGAKS